MLKVYGDIDFRDINNCFASSVYLEQDGQYTGMTVRYRCYENISKYDILTSHVERDKSGWKRARCSSDNRMPAHGIALENCSAGDDCLILLAGTIRNSAWSSFPHLSHVFVSSSLGQVMTNASNTTGHINQKIGTHYGDGSVNFLFDSVWWRMV